MARRRSGSDLSAQPTKSISINLMDLNRKYERPKSPSPYVVKQEQHSKSDVNVSDLLGSDNAYHKELHKLLDKAKGTPYEASMRKFITSKLGHGAVPPGLYEPSEAFSLNTEDEEDLHRHKKYLKQREKIDELATPLHRTDRAESPRRFNYASTNSLGRQRPAPSQADHRKPIGSGPISVREFNTWLRRTNRWKQGVNDSVRQQQSIYII
jgi:hypothetical protein